MSVAQFTLPLLIGTILNWGLFGALLVQVYIYFSVFAKDRPWPKLIVVLIVVLEVIETFSSFRDMVEIFGTGWGNPDALDNVGWAWFSVPVMGSIIAFICQTFYGWRIYIIGQNSSFFALITLVSTVQLAAGIWTGVEICMAKRFSLLQSHNLMSTATWLATTSAADLLIVFATIFYLRKAAGTEFTSAKTKSNISRIIMVTAETGVLCAVFALFDLFLFVSYKGTNYHLSLCLELSKIYSNSILLIFNSRAHMGHGCSYTTSSYSVELSSATFRTRVPRAPQIDLEAITSSDLTATWSGKTRHVEQPQLQVITIE
ncbi:hypothetical protein K438DRAFT_1721110 [Mycena galopus ATCC 62051]|nr:hypothetical protein K438DRAFT_1721110 [Mycena galopus ATCC 62051]